MDLEKGEAASALGKFITRVNNGLPRSFWFRVLDSPVTDDPETVDIPIVPDDLSGLEKSKLVFDEKKAKEKKIRLRQLMSGSFQLGGALINFFLSKCLFLWSYVFKNMIRGGV